MVSEKEILDALNIIQNVCIEQGEKHKNINKCSTCILRNGNNTCGVIETSSGDVLDWPSQWELKEKDNPRIILN